MRGEALEQIKALDRLIGGWDQALGRRAQGDPLTRRLMSVPGVGVQTALAFQAFVGEVERFASAKKVASYFGLAPRERSSGNETGRRCSTCSTLRRITGRGGAPR